MKKNARILSLLLAVVMMCGMIVIPTSAADAAKATVKLAFKDVSGTEATLAKDGTVTVTVSVENNPGFAGFAWIIKHSENVVLKDIVTGGSYTPPGAPAPVEWYYLSAKPEANVAEKKISYANPTGFTTANTPIFELVFEAKEEIKYNEISVTVEKHPNQYYLLTDVNKAEVPCELVSIVAKTDAPGQDVEVVAPETCDDVEVYLIEAQENAVLKAAIEAAGIDPASVEYFIVNALAHFGSKEVAENKPTGSSGGVIDKPAEEITQPTSNLAGEGNESPEIVSQPTSNIAGEGNESPEIVPTNPSYPIITNPSDEILPEGEKAGDGCVYGEPTEADKAKGISLTFDVIEPAEGEYTYRVWFINEKGAADYVDVEVVNGKITVNLPYTTDVAVTASKVVPAVEEELSDAIIIPRLLPVTVKVGEGAKINTTAKFLIAFGARRTINITVEEGYEVVDILVNGKSVGVADSYTLKGVAKAQNIVIKTAAVVEETIPEVAPATETAE